MNPQYKKGVIELCVLSMLYRRDRYGYEVSEDISKHIDIADGTVYPIFRKLKSNGMVTTYLSEESGGPPRKYYALTKLGKAAAALRRPFCHQPVYRLLASGRHRRYRRSVGWG